MVLHTELAFSLAISAVFVDIFFSDRLDDTLPGCYKFLWLFPVANDCLYLFDKSLIQNLCYHFCAKRSNKLYLLGRN